ncbi:MAG: ATP-binding cassette domain-containing protein [Phycisphaerales bacterium]
MTPSSETNAPLLEVSGLTVRFAARGGLLGRGGGGTTAVDGVSFSLGRGETLGLVGESGCGKTTVGRAVLRLIPAAGGSVRFEGEDVLSAGRERLRRLRRHMQIVFQDPGSSLNPRMRIEHALTEPLLVHGVCGGVGEARSRAGELLGRCGMPASALGRYPHEFSGGQKQRIAIARALALNPRFIVCDEPTSALDVSVQAQVLNLLADLQRDLSLSYLFISHDMGVIQHLCGRIAVMQEGRIVETGARDEVLHRARHPYTQRLLAAVPRPEPSGA